MVATIQIVIDLPSPVCIYINLPLFSFFNNKIKTATIYGILSSDALYPFYYF